MQVIKFLQQDPLAILFFLKCYNFSSFYIGSYVVSYIDARPPSSLYNIFSQGTVNYIMEGQILTTMLNSDFKGNQAML